MTTKAVAVIITPKRGSVGRSCFIAPMSAKPLVKAASNLKPVFAANKMNVLQWWAQMTVSARPT